MSAGYTGPRIGDAVKLGGTVVELAAHGGVPGALIDVGGGAAPIWVPIETLTVVKRGAR